MSNVEKKKDISVDIFGNTITLNFSNGASLALSTDELNEEILKNAVMHGLKQKLVDAGAIGRNPETGKSATIEEKFNAVHRVYSTLLSGAWNLVRDGEGAQSGLLFRALCEFKQDVEPDQIKMWLDSLDKTAQNALRKNPKIAEIIANLKPVNEEMLEKAENLLDELNDL